MLVRDPIHGDVALSRLETAVLDFPEVQRLRGIKQLGTAYLVYPGAVHSRFEHSLGTCAVAHRIIASIRRQGATVPDDFQDTIGTAALLHDVTHVPFGHTLEDERRLFPRHDKGDRLARLLEGRLGGQLERLGVRKAVAGLLGAAAGPLPPWAGDIVSSTIDADLLDYLRRDSRYAGLAQDYDDRVFRYFTLAGDRLALTMTKHGMARPDARSEIIQLLRMRYFLTERVYYHHTKVVAGAMISKAIELAVDQGVLREADLFDLNDWTLLDRLHRASVPATSALVARVKRRDLLKRAYVVSAHTISPQERGELVHRYHESRLQRREAEEELASAAGCAAGEVILYCPALTVMKEAAAPVCAPDGITPLTEAEGEGLSEIKALAARHADLWRLFVFAPAERIRQMTPIASEFFGHPSEYVPRNEGGREQSP